MGENARVEYTERSMAYTPTVLAFSGSARERSFNTRLLNIAVASAENYGAAVTVVDWRERPIPLFNQDDEEAKGLPENAKYFKELMKAHDGLLIAAPEYNSSITPLLKNALDWASRREGDEPPLVAFKGKTAVLMSASPGALGGLRGLVHLRAILGNINMLVLPDQQAVPRAHEAFEKDGSLRDKQIQERIERLPRVLIDTLRKLHGCSADGT